MREQTVGSSGSAAMLRISCSIGVIPEVEEGTQGWSGRTAAVRQGITDIKCSTAVLFPNMLLLAAVTCLIGTNITVE